MSNLVEFYVRKRDTPNDDRRTGTLAVAPVEVRIGDQVIRIDPTEGDIPLVIAIDELGTNDSPPPTRILAGLAQSPLTREELAARKRDGIPLDHPITRAEVMARAEQAAAAASRPAKPTRKGKR